MFFSAIKLVAYFSLSFLILSFPIQDKHVFNYLEKISRPLTAKVYFFINKKAKESINESKKYFKDKKPSIKKRINSTFSAQNKKELVKDIDKYTQEEKEAIKKILSDSF